jgi:hypothetical protein
VHNIKPIEDFLNEQCVKIVQRILKDRHHSITTSIHRNKYNNNIIMPRTNTVQYQNSVLQKTLRIIHDGPKTNRNEDGSIPRRDPGNIKQDQKPKQYLVKRQQHLPHHGHFATIPAKANER